MRSADGKFDFVIKNTEFRDQAGGNEAKKKTYKWRENAMLAEIDNISFNL